VTSVGRIYEIYTPHIPNTNKQIQIRKRVIQMKFSDLIAGHDYAIIPSWQYSSRDKKDPDRVRKNDVVKANLVSLTKYEYKVFRSHQPDDSGFVKAKQGERAVGYLVVAKENNQDMYWLARPQDIVALWATLEPRWNEEKRQEEEERKKAEQEQLKREEERRIAQANKERMETSLRDTLTGILGNRVTPQSVQFDTNNVRVNNEYKTLAVVQVELSLMETLIEKVLEAKDLVA
jgi:hypothetical protein